MDTLISAILFVNIFYTCQCQEEIFEHQLRPTIATATERNFDSYRKNRHQSEPPLRGVLRKAKKYEVYPTISYEHERTPPDDWRPDKPKDLDVGTRSNDNIFSECDPQMNETPPDYCPEEYKESVEQGRLFDESPENNRDIAVETRSRTVKKRRLPYNKRKKTLSKRGPQTMRGMSSSDVERFIDSMKNTFPLCAPENLKLYNTKLKRTGQKRSNKDDPDERELRSFVPLCMMERSVLEYLLTFEGKGRL